MIGMFRYSSFNRDIGGWDVSSVTDMGGMFASSSFNQDIGGWNVDNVEDIDYMFYDASNFNQNLNAWDDNGWGGSAPTMTAAFGGSCICDPEWYTGP